MAGLEDIIRSAAPGGNIGKPLMLALLGLLASGALFRSGGGDTADTATQTASDEGAGGLLGGLGGLLDKLQKGGLGSAAIVGRNGSKSNRTSGATWLGPRH